MKRCPQCGRNYNDDSMSFCLDDGSELLFGPANSQDLEEQKTAILQETVPSAEAPRGAQMHTAEKTSALPSTTAEVPKKRLDKRLMAAAIVAVVIAVGVYIGYRYLGSPAKQVGSIAVMPFVNDSGNADVEYLSDGMTETLINSLSQIPNLNVKARSSVFRYKGKEVDPKTIASELHVQAILTGHIVQRADQMTLNLELVDAETENTIWGNRYERKSSDIVSLQSEIARDVSLKLKSKLSDADNQKVAKNYTVNPEALKLYLQGQFSANKGTSADLRQAAVFYNQAIEKDPNYGLAYASLAATYTLFPAFDIEPANVIMPQAKAAALRALELDDSLAEGHTALGYYLIHYEFDLNGSEREFRRAIELNPNSSDAHQALAFRFMVVKRFDESFAESKLAEDLDPLSASLAIGPGSTFVYARRYDEGIALFKAVLSRDPGFALAHGYLGWAYGAKGMHAEAVSEARKSVELTNSSFLKGYLALWLGKSGDRGEAQKILAELKKAAAEGYVRPNTLAIAYLGVGDKSAALDQLENEVSSRGPLAILFGVGPEFDDVRSEPRFKALLKQMNLPE